MAETAPAGGRPRGTWFWVVRVTLLAVAGVSLYLLAPSLLAVFSSWPELKHLDPLWLLAALAFEVLSYVSLWEVWRIVLRTPSWYAVGTAQLVGGAMGSVVPGGGATAGAFSYRMLVRAGIRGDAVAAGMTASFVATTSAVLALPVLAVPAILGGVTAPRGLLETAYVGAAVFVVILGVGAAVLFADAPLRAVGRAVRWLLARIHRGDAATDLPERLLAQRDAVRGALGARWRLGIVASVGKWGFDYLCLVCCLAAVGSRPEPALVLLAYAGASILSMIPVTPGGLGFVEAGLTGLLALAGVGGQDAVVATLAYRLLGFWLPLLLGGVAWLLFRRRYGSADPTLASNTPS